MITRLIIESEEQLECLIDFLEDGMEEAHQITVEEKDEEIVSDARSHLRQAKRLLRSVCPDHPLLDAGVRGGTPFDWDGFWKKMDDEDDGDEGDEPAPPSPDPSEVPEPVLADGPSEDGTE